MKSASLVWSVFLLFSLALVLRVLFLLATPDASGSLSPYYKGDTPYWLEYASALRSASTFDLGLPLRPPGVAYLVSAIWNGQPEGFLSLKLAWAGMGAATVALLFLAVFRSFGFGTALVAAFICAVSTGLMVVSTSINNETPYLLLVIASFTFWESLRRRPALQVLIPWSVLNALACLIRAEHVLLFALLSMCLAWLWMRESGAASSWKQGLGRVALAWAIFGLTLLPWQLHTWAQIGEFNQQPLALDASAEQVYTQLEQTLSVMNWTAEAERKRDTLPVFAQRPMSLFVASTVAVRGRMEVRGDDFKIVNQAFGSWPEPLEPFPFITIYGGLNFYLANNPSATGGFTRAPLEAPPPLAGGPSHYPAFLISGLPPPELTFSYPPHLEIVNHGYRLGRNWIFHHPGDALSLAVQKIRRFWSGVTMGLGGYSLPLGLSGTRRAVDLVVPRDNTAVSLWRWSLVAVLLGGLWAGRREVALMPWLLLLLTKLFVTLVFFGYAREGVVVIPALAVLTGLLVTRGFDTLSIPRTRTGRFFKPVVLMVVLAIALITVEGIRLKAGHEVILDGQYFGTWDPYPAKEYQDRSLEVR